MSKLVWHPWMIEKLRGQYPDGDTQELALMLGVTATSLRTKAYDLQVKKSEAFVIAQREKAMARCVGTRFKAGHPSWNKGKKGSIVVTDGMRKTMFRPGQKPHNTTYDGCISVIIDKRGVRQFKIRVSEANSEYLSRYNYRKAFGPIPKNHVIKFRDGDALNCDPSNLECVSRTLLMLLNAKHGYTRDIAEVKEVLCYIKQEIKDPCNAEN